MISQYAWWIIVGAVLIGHFGLNIAIYNRINGFGLPRKVIKGIVKFFFVLTILLPPLTIYLYGDLIADLAAGRVYLDVLPNHLLAYSIVCLASWIVLGIPWLLWRPIFGLESIEANRNVQVVDVQEISSQPLGLTWKCQIESRLPLNQIFDLAVEEVELPVYGLPESMDGYRISHLSDVHLTGHVHPDFSQYAVERATQWQPDMMALTGDIIDSQNCIDWLPKIFARAEAPDGCYYVLGNHDTHIVDSSQTRDAMDRAGWTDLGSRTLFRRLGTVPTLLIGNEHPWFERPTVGRTGDEEFRLLLSHSPDQIGWARQNQIHLILAGHCHGGQGRLPLVGPILGPSLHGSRYASGDFFKRPTTMHVSRGLSGAHLVRINCRPELSLITLRSIPNGGGDT
jgi:predicted MPP superfamily phosphohydrolase